jgi:cellulose synthase/poly-beta-1,6-N-acetylglucosamine synthase-like glycosyltransferase
MSVVFILAVVLLLLYACLILVYLYGWIRIRPFRESRASGETFSVIIPARNEEENIAACVRSVLHQDYDTSSLEVIVVDDGSDDTTSSIVKELAVDVPNLRLLTRPPGAGTKKDAITEAVKVATGSYIVLTDADCTRGPGWLASISAFVQQNKPALVYAPVRFTAHTWFQKIQALEFAGLVGIGAAAIQLRNPNMCSAANLIFRKDVFSDVDGYKGNDHLASGDDEFLLHKVFRKYPADVHFLRSRQAIVTTSANNSLAQLAQQRRRWVSKSTRYENRYITAILVGAYFFNLSLLVTLLLHPLAGLALIAGKATVEGIFLWNVLSFFQQGSLLFLLPVAEPFHIAYVLVIGIWANVTNYTWKGRRLK